MKVGENRYTEFKVMVRGGISPEMLQAELTLAFAYTTHEPLVLPCTTISEINYNYVLEQLQNMDLLHQMNLGQRNRAYEAVKREFTQLDEVDKSIQDIIKRNWDAIVFGDSDA